MDLRGGQPLWPKLCPVGLARPPISGPIACDVLIVGSGITGALAAFHLAEAGCKVVVLDRRPIARGSTPASTALLQYDIDTPLNELRRRLGADRADAAYRRSRSALDDMAALQKRLNISCAISTRPSLYLAREPCDVEELHREMSARAEIGLEVEFLDRRSLRSEFGLRSPGAILSRYALEIDPWLFTNHLLLAAEKLGSRIYSHVSLSPGGPPWRTGDGHTISTGQVIFATGYETPEQFTELRGLCSLNSTYVLATEPIEPNKLWPRQALIWDTASPYLYARTTADRRVIIGGGDERFQDAHLRDLLIPAKRDALLQEFNSIFPLGPVNIETAWAGTFAQTPDGLPYIGGLNAYPSCYFALGYGGNGITFSLIAAQIIRDEILGRANPSAALFSFSRMRVPALAPASAFPPLGARHHK